MVEINQCHVAGSLLAGSIPAVGKVNLPRGYLYSMNKKHY